VAAFFATLIPTIVQQVTQIVQQAPQWVQAFIDSEFFRSVDSQFGIRDRIAQELAKFVNNPDAMGGIFGGVVGFGSTVANGIFGALIVLVLSLYFLGALGFHLCAQDVKGMPNAHGVHHPVGHGTRPRRRLRLTGTDEPGVGMPRRIRPVSAGSVRPQPSG
jgi:hypothetical protein